MQHNILLAVLIALALRVAHAHRILGLFPVPIRSHYAFNERLLLELVRRGHEVDVVTHYPRGDAISGYTELSVAGSAPLLEDNVSVAGHAWKTAAHYAWELAQLGNGACASVLQHPVVGALATPARPYDLIIAEVYATDCLLPYAHIYRAPIVGISSTGLMPWADERMGNPDNPAYIPNYFLPLRGRLSFPEKVASAVMNVASKAWYYVLLTVPAEIRGREVFGATPPIEDIARGTLLLLANRHFSMDAPRPLVPGVVEVGGMHIGAVKPLQPQRLADFVNASAEGVIYFSMGSLINMETFAPAALDAILAVFGALRQRVVMRIGSAALGARALPANVHATAWAPQLDVLCHPRTRLFITHGGLLSVQEAAHCAVPIIGIPFHPQQVVNVRNYVAQGAGIQLEYAALDTVELGAAIAAILANASSRHATHAARLSRLFRDRPVQPLPAAVYWVEYALRHGGRHLRPLSADLIAFEYLLVDVAVVGVALALIACYVLYMLLQFLQELFDRPPPPPPADKRD